MSSSVRRRITWIAALAVLAMALAPAISQWLLAQRSPGLAWVAVCASTGTRWVAVDESARDSQHPASGQHDQSHCPACHLQANGLGLPPQPLNIQVLPAEPEGLPFLFLHAPRTLAAWSPSIARAPPAAA